MTTLKAKCNRSNNKGWLITTIYLVGDFSIERDINCHLKALSDTMQYYHCPLKPNIFNCLRHTMTAFHFITSLGFGCKIAN